MNIRKIFAIAVGVTVTIARLFSFFKRSETPSEREQFNHLWELSLGMAVNGLLGEGASLSDPILPRRLDLFHSFDAHERSRSLLGEPVLVPTLPRETIAIPANRFEDRLKRIGYEGEVPEEFVDNVITFEIMDDPVIVTTATSIEGREKRTDQVYDRTTYLKFRGICPLTKLHFIEQKDHPTLKAEIENFVSKKEDEAKLSTPILRN